MGRFSQGGHQSKDLELMDQRARFNIRIMSAVDHNAPDYESILGMVLKIQGCHAISNEALQMQREQGFLGTTWTLAQVHALIGEGGWLVAAIDMQTSELQAYSLVSLISHLPCGRFTPVEGSPIQSRTELGDKERFMYGYQLARHPTRSLTRIHVAREVFLARYKEAARRRISIVSCVMDAPIQNRRSQEFLASMAPRCKRVGVIHAPNGPPLIPGPVTWVCFVTWPVWTGVARVSS